MKKLLALVLCIVMVLSLVPAAFAETDIKTVTATKPAQGDAAWQSVSTSKTAISNAKKNIEYVYGTLAADTAVFGAIKSADSIITDLAKGLFDGIDSYTYVKREFLDSSTGKATVSKITLSNSTLVDNTKSVLRDIIGSSITTYLNKHIGDFATIGTYLSTDKKGNNVVTATGATTKDGVSILSNGKYFLIYDSKTETYKKVDDTTKTLEDLAKEKATTNFGTNIDTIYNQQYYKYDPIKYANTYAAAMSDAFSSEKGAKGIEALVYALYYASAAKEVSDKMDDLADEIAAWEGTDALLAQYGFNESWDPYSFLNNANVPKTVSVPAGVLAPDSTSVIIVG